MTKKDDETCAKEASNGSMPLLGLEPTDTENTGENSVENEDSNRQTLLTPLLGTNYLKLLHKSSQARSSERVCYDSLLRFGAHSSELSIGKTVKNGPRGCYGLSA